MQIPSKKDYLLTCVGATLVVSGDGRYYSEQAIQVKKLYMSFVFLPNFVLCKHKSKSITLRHFEVFFLPFFLMLF